MDPMPLLRSFLKVTDRLPQTCLLLITGLIGLSFSSQASGQAAEPALWMRLVEPKIVWQQVISLCDGTPYASPAMALAAAKHAGLKPAGGNKTLEAAIAFLNQPVLPDLKLLEQLVISLDPDVQNRKVDWRVAAPTDDGTADALVTAFALDHTEAQANIGAAQVERLGPNLMVARSAGQVYFGPDRRALERGLSSQIDQKLLALAAPVKSGLWLRADPRQWPSTIGRTAQERIAIEALRRLSGGHSIELRSFPWGESAQTECIDLLRLLPSSPVQPQWLAKWEPALNGRLMAQASIGLDPRKPFWSKVFEIATDLERTMPGRERVANLRDRINIASLLARISPETDLYPNLIGVTIGAVTPDSPKSEPTIVATLHARDTRATQILVEKVLVPVIRTLGEDPKTPRAMQTPPRSDTNIRGLAIVQGRPIFLFLDAPDICLVWGARNVAEAVVARSSSGPAPAETIPMKWLQQFAQGGPVHRAAAVYPEAVVRWRVMMGEPASPWTDASKGLPPVVWLGRSSGGVSRDIFAFSGFRGYVQSLIARIPPMKEASE